MPGDVAPLILDGERLYLYRYWQYERQIILFLNNIIKAAKWDADWRLLQDGIQKYFGAEHAKGINWQIVASVGAVVNKFCVISGGPGTGKTTTVTRILALLAEQFQHQGLPIRIMLAAPTGKAAARLQESVAAVKKKLYGSDIPNVIPDTAMTLHRMLGSQPNSPYFYYNDTNPLPADVIVVDEASMVDLPLMAKLMAALPPQCRLILVGDRNQLASVEPGSVFADICNPQLLASFSGRFCEMVKRTTGMHLDQKTEDEGGLQDSLVELKHVYRFEGQGGIAMLGDAVQKGDMAAVEQIFEDDTLPEVSWREIKGCRFLQEMLSEHIAQNKYGYLQATVPEDVFADFDQFMVLCALRHGPFGVEEVNRLIERHLNKTSRKTPGQAFIKPIMVTRNDYNLHLFNGDIGLLWQQLDTVHGVFKGEAETYAKIPHYRLPPFEAAYAMTVHKCQGSEFDSVLLILPDQHAPVLTRELLYTAITRARKKVEVWGSKEVIQKAVESLIERESGIREALSMQINTSL